MRILSVLTALVFCSCSSTKPCASCCATGDMKKPTAGGAMDMAKKGAAATPQGQAAAVAAAAAKKAQ